jgi:hypothetical protein
LPGLKGCQTLCAPIAPLEALFGFISMALGTASARRYKSRFRRRYRRIARIDAVYLLRSALDL